MTRFSLPALTAALATALVPIAAAGQPKGEVGQFSDVTVEGSVLEPSPIRVSDDAELAGLITAPEGFTVEVFARDLVNPRMLAVSDDNVLYATRRSVGDVIMLKDGDGDGKADVPVTVASRAGMHGIAFDGDRVFLATVNDVYVADVREDGSFGELERIINDLPDGGQHPNRTLGIGPDDHLYISAGSTCNACAETNPESATLLRASKDGTSRTIFAEGLRNTIGFDWQPESGELWGMDHGIDWLGDEEQVEELNQLEQGKQYGWPYVYGMGEFNPQDNPPEGITLEQWAELSTEPVLGYTAHSAPMQMAFYDAGAFPEEYRGDAFIAMRGSWNRRPPSGYEVMRVDFENGEPVGFEPFLYGLLIEPRTAATAISPGWPGWRWRRTARSTSPTTRRHDLPGDLCRDRGGAECGSQTPPTSCRSRRSRRSRSPWSSRPATQASRFRRVRAAVTDPPQACRRRGQCLARHRLVMRPEGTQSYVVIMDDPDAAAPKPFVHWIAYDMPAGLTALREGLPTEPVLADSEGQAGHQQPRLDRVHRAEAAGGRSRRTTTTSRSSPSTWRNSGSAGRPSRGGAQGDGRARARGGRDRRHIRSSGAGSRREVAA